jgi:hypothetical protein
MSVIYNSGVYLIGVNASGTTALASDLLSGKTAVSNGTGTQQVITGTMTNSGTISETYSLPINGTYTYTFTNNSYADGGTITVNQSITTKGVQTYTISQSDQVISANVYLSGAQTIAAITFKETTNYVPSTSNQYIYGGQYLNGNQTILGSTNLVSSNIRSGVSIFGVAGSLVDYQSGQVDF